MTNHQTSATIPKIRIVREIEIVEKPMVIEKKQKFNWKKFDKHMEDTRGGTWILLKDLFLFGGLLSGITLIGLSFMISVTYTLILLAIFISLGISYFVYNGYKEFINKR